jgi:hypothetical protein
MTACSEVYTTRTQTKVTLPPTPNRRSAARCRVYLVSRAWSGRPNATVSLQEMSVSAPTAQLRRRMHAAGRGAIVIVPGWVLRTFGKHYWISCGLCYTVLSERGFEISLLNRADCTKSGRGQQ